MVPDALYGVFEMMDTPPIRSIICLGSSYVWSERRSEKPEVCWFDSDLRHQAPSVRKFIKHRWSVIRQTIRRRVSSMGRKHLVVQLSENLKE